MSRVLPLPGLGPEQDPPAGWFNPFLGQWDQGPVIPSARVRIQLHRTAGWRKPDDVIVVARPGKWGNPFKVAQAIDTGWAESTAGAQVFVVECFADWLAHGRLSEWWFADGAATHEWMVENIHALSGKVLGCWCRPDKPCHADVLWHWANR